MSKFKILLTLIAVSFQEDPISNIIVTREKYLEYKSDVVDGALDPMSSLVRRRVNKSSV